MFLSRAALNIFISQPVLVLEAASTQVQHLELGPVETLELPMGPLLEAVNKSQVYIVEKK